MRVVHLRVRDWLGPACLTVFLGIVVTAAEFLPWANAHGSGDVDFSWTRSAWVSGAFVSSYSRPALAVGVLVIVCGLLMLLLGPSRVSFWPGLVTLAAGFVAVFLADRAAATIRYPMRAGLGLYLLTLAGVLLVPVGFAGAIVGYMMRRQDRSTAD